MDKVFIIEVTTLGGLYNTSKVSQEAYSTYDSAKYFCENRGDKPKQIDDFTWISEYHKYTILEIYIK